MWWWLFGACLVQEVSVGTGDPGELHSLYPGMPPGAALRRAEQLGTSLGWTACTHPARGLLRCAAPGPGGEPDTVEVQADAYGPRYSRLQVRSSGQGWLGARRRHRDRIAAFSAAWEAQPGRDLDPAAPAEGSPP